MTSDTDGSGVSCELKTTIEVTNPEVCVRSKVQVTAGWRAAILSGCMHV